MKTQKYRPPKVIAVDVDGTLFTRGTLNTQLVDWCRHKKQEGFTMILWSLRGADHAKQAAEISRLAEVFDIIMGKPGYIVDDKGWSWIKHTCVVRSIETQE